MTYRAAFREGDRIKVGDVVGTVEEIKLMVTKVRTPKNEQVIIPNSNILNDNVTNYSHMARRGGVILHTVVGIGYDTPWRQVEALLLMATERTEGLLKDPPPFVLQKSLGDFARQLRAECLFRRGTPDAGALFRRCTPISRTCSTNTACRSCRRPTRPIPPVRRSCHRRNGTRHRPKNQGDGSNGVRVKGQSAHSDPLL